MLRTRLAPTPSGFLHIGNAYSFVYTWLQARRQGGSIHLRIDDIDGERARAEYVEDIFRTIDWLGIDYDTGPSGVDDFYQHHSQQLRIDYYQQFLDELRRDGHLFACTCSRAQLAAGVYAGHCVDLSLDWEAVQTAWRARLLPDTVVYLRDEQRGELAVAVGKTMPYFVLRTKARRAAYQLVSVVEDVEQGINYIVRGEDLLDSSAAQHWLAARLPSCAGFLETRLVHHPLWTDAQGQKLSKSKGADSLRAWRESGRTSAEFYHQLSDWARLPQAVSSAQEWLERLL